MSGAHEDLFGYVRPVEVEEGVKGLAREDDPETSHEAADQVDASKLMKEIYGFMVPFGEVGCIGDQLFDLMPHHDKWTIAPRIIQMVQRGMIERTGEKRKGHHNGRNQLVHRVLKPPFIRQVIKRKETDNEKLLDQIRTEVKMLRNVTSRLTMAEDRVRMNYIVQRLEELVQ